MNIGFVIFLLAAAFVTGFSVGLFLRCNRCELKPRHAMSYSRLNLPLNEEYQNFLSYDGTMQK